MQIYIMRHGEAKMLSSSDQERALTDLGKYESQKIAKWLAKQLPEQKLDMVLVSPYVRAQQTWAACQGELPKPKHVMTEQDITPYGNSGDVAAYLRSLAMVEKPHNILLISHLPLVGYLTAEFAPMTPPMFATSGISCIEYDVNTDKSELLWLKMPSGLPIEHE